MSRGELLRFYGAAVACIMVAVLTNAAIWAHDHDNPENNAWLQGLASPAFGVCCSGDDTTLDVSWQITGDPEFPYKVLQGKAWIPVPKGSVVDQHNRMGIGLAWFGFKNGEPWVRCFLPGTTA